MMTKFKKWIIALLFGSAVLAAPLILPNNSFEKLDRVQKIGERYELDFGHGSKITIGGDEADFKPKAKLTKWDDEVAFEVWLETDKKIKPRQADKKLKWIEKKREVHFYTIDDDKFEFEIILNEKPASNVVELKIDTRGLAFYYQPELTQEEKNGGAIRPENVIGSYAVYHESKQGDYSKMGGKNYMAGKAFHIYRPKIIDSAGTGIWGKLNIDIKNKLLTVEIPQGFLDNAVYPVRHAAGLTFGNNNEGGSIGYYCNNWAVGAKGTTGASGGSATKITAYLKTSSSVNCQSAIYEWAEPADRIGESVDGTNVSGVTYAWHDITFASSISVGASTNYAAVINCDGANSTTYTAYDSGDALLWLFKDESYDSWPVADWAYTIPTFSDRLVSIYCTYAVDEDERRIINIQ